MFHKQRTLGEVIGREAFKKLLGARVRGNDGVYIGYLKKVYIDRRSGKAKRLVIKLVDGRSIVTDPNDAVLNNDEIILKNKIKVSVSDIAGELQRLEQAVKELRGIRERFLDLDEALIAGEISKDTYACFREALEQKRKKLLSEARDLLEKLEVRLHRLEEERDALMLKLSSVGRESGTELLKKLREVRETLVRVYELIESARHEMALEMELDDFLQSYLRA